MKIRKIFVGSILAVSAGCAELETDSLDVASQEMALAAGDTAASPADDNDHANAEAVLWDWGCSGPNSDYAQGEVINDADAANDGFVRYFTDPGRVTLSVRLSVAANWVRTFTVSAAETLQEKSFDLPSSVRLAGKDVKVSVYFGISTAPTCTFVHSF